MSTTEDALFLLALGDSDELMTDDITTKLMAPNAPISHSHLNTSESAPLKYPKNELRKWKKKSNKKNGIIIPFDSSTMIESLENETKDEQLQPFSINHSLNHCQQKVKDNVSFYYHSLKSFIFDRNSHFSNFIFIFTLLLLFISEASQRRNSHKYPVYNLPLIMFLDFFQVYKANLDTYLVLTTLIVSSILLDIVYICYNSIHIFIALSVSIVIVTKIYYIGLYLHDDFMNIKLARKYLTRRLRLFLCYTSGSLIYSRAIFNTYSIDHSLTVATIRDSRIMREVRGKVLAISILQNISLMFYCIELYHCLTTFSKANNRIFSYPYLGIPIPIFLIFKVLFMTALAGLVLWDTKIFLCFNYFGCCFSCNKFIQNYYSKLTKKYGGEPYIYAFHRTRYKQMRLIKFVDMCYSLVGWITILYYFFNSRIYNPEQTGINVYLILVLMTLVVSDLWIPLLLYRNVNSLLMRYDEVRREVDLESDDSEIEELNIKMDRDMEIIY